MSAESVPEPQQERSRETRRRLLETAVDVLVDDGLAGASTGRVSRRAGLSQGALFKHFPTKALLLGAAAERLFDGLVTTLADAEEDGESDLSGDPVGSAMRALDRFFRSSRIASAAELMVASRTDASLRAALEQPVARFRDALRREALGLFPEDAASSPDFVAFVDVLLAALYGRALARMVAPQPSGAVGEQVALHRLARRELEAATGTGAR